MKHLITLLAISTLLLVSTTITASAEIPRTINFQGKATDADNKPLTTPHNITFRIYESETEGTPTDAIWTETHTTVSIDNGVFSVQLGNATPTPTSLNLAFDIPYWISIEIDTTDGTGELSPRQPITSVGYAYHTEKAQHAITADALTVSEIPSGTIMLWAGAIANIPSGWLECNGDPKDRDVYPDLFAAIGTIHGGDGNPNFNLPDLTEKFVIGAEKDDGGKPKTDIESPAVYRQSGDNAIHNHGGVVDDANDPVQFEGGGGGGGVHQTHNHAVNSDYHIPPFYTMVFIIKE